MQKEEEKTLAYYFVFERKTYRVTVWLPGNRGIGKVVSPSGEQKWCPGHWREEKVAKITRKVRLMLTEKTNLESVLDALGGR